MLFALALSRFFGLKFRAFALTLSRSYVPRFFALPRSSIFRALFSRSSIFRALFRAPRFFAHVHLRFLIFALKILCSCDRTARTGHPEQDRQNRTGRTGQPEQDSQNRTSRTGQTEQDSLDRRARTGQPGHESQDRTGRNKTGRTGKAEQDGQTEEDRLSFLCSPVLAVLFCYFCPCSLVLPVPFWLPRSGCPVLSASHAFPFLAVFSFQFCPSCLVLAALCWQPYPGSPILAPLSWQFCPGSCPRSPVMEVSFCLSHSSCSFLAVLSFSGCQILFGQSCPACSVLPVLFCLSCYSPLLCLFPSVSSPCLFPLTHPSVSSLTSFPCATSPVFFPLCLFPCVFPLCLFPRVFSPLYFPLCLFNLSTELQYLTQDPCFPPAERLWALKPDFHCGGRIRAFFLSRSALTLFSRSFLFVLSRSFLLRACEREGAKKAPAPTSAFQGITSIVMECCNIYRIL
jgi:hypothetical protein